jgi:hypothetical protein
MIHNHGLKSLKIWFWLVPGPIMKTAGSLYIYFGWGGGGEEDDTTTALGGFLIRCFFKKPEPAILYIFKYHLHNTDGNQGQY